MSSSRLDRAPGRRKLRLWLGGGLLLAVVGVGAGHHWLQAPPADASPAARAAPRLPSAAGDARAGGRLPAEAAAPSDAANMERRLLQAVRYLASDELEGRGLGTAGIERAADFIAQEFQRGGLRAAAEDGTPFQRFARSVKFGLSGRNAVALAGPDALRQELSLRQDFLPLSLSGSGAFALPLVFVGYGITAPDVAYDDYAGLDVTGKAVLILRHEPRPLQRHGHVPAGESSPQAHLSSKVANAVRHGAAAVIFCTDYQALQPRVPTGGAGQSAADRRPAGVSALDTLLGFQVNGAVAKRQIPVLHILRPFLEQAVRQATGQELRDLERDINEQSRPQSRRLEGWQIAGEVNVGQTVRDLKNVLATLEGQGPAAQETIVLGAHYDHLGFGGAGSLSSGSREIHHGADDNASGTAAILELGRQFAARPTRLPRRLLFLAFTGEESGLLGSEYYVGHPVVPLRQTVAMVNLDMIGYLRQERLEISGSGTAVEFDPLLRRLGPTYGFRLELEPGGDGPSDHASFFEQRIPVLHLFTGLHAHYHRPSDTWDKLDIRGLRRITQFTQDLVTALAEAGPRPHFRGDADDELFEAPRRRPPTAAPPQAVTLGVSGQLADDGGGYLVRQVAQGSPAAQAGIRPGDRILQIGPRTVSRLEDARAAMQSVTAGTRLPIRLQRGGVALEVEVAIP